MTSQMAPIAAASTGSLTLTLSNGRHRLGECTGTPSSTGWHHLPALVGIIQCIRLIKRNMETSSKREELPTSAVEQEVSHALCKRLDFLLNHAIVSCINANKARLCLISPVIKVHDMDF